MRRKGSRRSPRALEALPNGAHDAIVAGADAPVAHGAAAEGRGGVGRSEPDAVPRCGQLLRIAREPHRDALGPEARQDGSSRGSRRNSRSETSNRGAAPAVASVYSALSTTLNDPKDSLSTIAPSLARALRNRPASASSASRLSLGICRASAPAARSTRSPASQFFSSR